VAPFIFSSLVNTAAFLPTDIWSTILYYLSTKCLSVKMFSTKRRDTFFFIFQLSNEGCRVFGRNQAGREVHLPR